MTDCNKHLSLCKSTTREKIWLEDITELYKNGNYIKFVPTYAMSRNEQMNAVSRFAIYMILLLVIFNITEEWIMLPIVLLVIVIFLYKFNIVDPDGKSKEWKKIIDMRKEKRYKEKEAEFAEYQQDGDSVVTLDIDDNVESGTKKDIFGNVIKDVQAGYYDSDGKLIVGSKHKLPKYKGDQQYEDKTPYTIDEISDYRKNTCRKPTPDNPFMNQPVTDFGTEDPPAACNADDDDIKENIKVNFNHDLFRDVDELWERQSSARNYYTMPNTAIPNGQTEFAKWLYQLPDSATCKVDGTACLRYDPLTNRRNMLSGV